jgi:hypothetical protein
VLGQVLVLERRRQIAQFLGVNIEKDNEDHDMVK